MIIRSQDKKGIINLNNMDTIGIEPNCCGCDVVGYNGTQESRVKLGTYSTEKKAIKVLDMIAEEYLYCERCKARGEEAGVIPGYVFQMPSDEEVEV